MSCEQSGGAPFPEGIDPDTLGFGGIQLKEENVKTRQLALRLPEPVLERVGRYVERLRGATPGVDVRRADALRALILAGLDAGHLKPE